MITIFLDTPNLLMKETLGLLLSREGFAPTSRADADPRIVLKDLQGHAAPYPPPPPYRTLALVAAHENDLVHLLYLGYKGYLRPSEGGTTIVKAVRAVLRGEVWGERKLIARALEKHAAPSLTRREHEVHHLVVRGLSNREVAEELGIAEKTVKGYMSSLLSKLGARKRTELILNAHKAHAERS